MSISATCRYCGDVIFQNRPVNGEYWYTKPGEIMCIKHVGDGFMVGVHEPGQQPHCAGCGEPVTWSRAYEGNWLDGRRNIVCPARTDDEECTGHRVQGLGAALPTSLDADPADPVFAFTLTESQVQDVYAALLDEAQTCQEEGEVGRAQVYTALADLISTQFADQGGTAIL